jgi:dihydrofolate reductase
MPKLSVFESVSLDGYFTGENGDLSWAHSTKPDDSEWNDFVANNAKGGSTLLFGRVTYDMMVSYWPTPAAAKDNPVVAERMNDGPKVVFSRTLDRADWRNTTLVRGDPVAEVRRLKQASGPDLVVLGSGSIVSQLTQARLVDEYQLVVVPVVIGKGRPLFEGLAERMPLRRTEARTFANGNVFLRFEPSRG